MRSKEENYKKAIQYFKKSGDLRQETEVTYLAMYDVHR